MRGRNLKDFQISGIGQARQKVDAGEIEARAEFGQHGLLPVGLLVRQSAIGHVRFADDQNPRVRPLLQDPRQRAHETVEAAQRLQTARGIGNDLLAGPESGAVRQAEGGVGIGGEDVAIHALMGDFNQRLKHSGKRRFLPSCRRDRRVGRGERQSGGGVAGVEGGVTVHAHRREFRVEADVAAFAAIVIFTIDDDSCGRKHDA